MENSHFSTSAAGASTISSSSPSQDRHSHLRSFSEPTANRKRGLAPSSFIHTEASPSTTLSSSSQEDQTIFPPQPRPHSRSSSSTDNRHSIASTTRPRSSRRLSIVSTKSTFDQSKTLWSQQSVLKRMSWGWNQTFAGLTPTQLTEVEIQRARPVQIDILKRQSPSQRLSIANSEYSTTSAVSTASTDTTVSPETAINKPFANRRVSIVKSTRPEIDLPPVEEEQSPDQIQDQEQETETDEMGLRRALSTRFMRSPSQAQADRKRPVISLPALISTTNAQLNDSMDIHPALRNSGSSAEYSTSPTTPISETPGLTDSSSVGSSRSSTNGSPTNDRFSVQPNHLTQYFPQLAPEKVADNVTVVSDDVFAVPAPALPTRAPSHSKREHERLARSRSMRSSGGFSRSSTQSAPREPIGRALTASSSRHASLEATKEEQPFATELAQVDEIHEDFYSLVLEEQKTNDEQVMKGGYRNHTPSVYMLDLADLEASRWD